jgi:hypothetical protein
MSKLADVGSTLLIDIFGSTATHVRSVIGVVALPRNAPVLIDFELRVRRPSCQGYELKVEIPG